MSINKKAHLTQDQQNYRADDNGRQGRHKARKGNNHQGQPAHHYLRLEDQLKEILDA